MSKLTPKALVAHPDPNVCGLFMSLFAGAGIAIGDMQRHIDPKTAVQALEESPEPFDLVVTPFDFGRGDVGMEGIIITTLARNRNPDVKMIMVTDARERDREQPGTICRPDAFMDDPLSRVSSWNAAETVDQMVRDILGVRERPKAFAT